MRRPALALAAILALAAPGAAQSPADKEAFGKAVRAYLLENPEVFVEALERYKEKEQQAEVAAFAKTFAQRRAQIIDSPDRPAGGNPKGDVTVVEFFDYRCGVCKRVYPIVQDLLRADRNVRMVFVEWPILGPESMFAARAALASRAQGKYEVYRNAMMAARTINEPAVFEIARQVGLDVERLKRDMERPEIEAAIRKNHEIAEALALNGTPTFIIGDQLVKGGRDLATLRQMVAAARQK
ncbi:MAG: DsbA family protein [Alphaproteobacteria bacterium]|nr:DsbA family protein [Alphaproteobacteria bacterium]